MRRRRARPRARRVGDVGRARPRGSPVAAAGSPLQLARVESAPAGSRRRLASGSPPAARALDRVPVLPHLGRRARRRSAAPPSSPSLAEDVRVAAHQLLGASRARPSARSPWPRSSSSSDEEVDLEQHVAELVEQLGVVAGVRRVGELVGLLDGVRDDAALVLLAVPGTSRRRRRVIASSSSSASPQPLVRRSPAIGRSAAAAGGGRLLAAAGAAWPRRRRPGSRPPEAAWRARRAARPSWGRRRARAARLRQRRRRRRESAEPAARRRRCWSCADHGAAAVGRRPAERRCRRARAAPRRSSPGPAALPGGRRGRRAASARGRCGSRGSRSRRRSRCAARQSLRKLVENWSSFFCWFCETSSCLMPCLDCSRLCLVAFVTLVTRKT